MHGSTRRTLLPFLALAVALACSKAEAPPSPSPYALPPTMAPGDDHHRVGFSSKGRAQTLKNAAVSLERLSLSLGGQGN